MVKCNLHPGQKHLLYAANTRWLFARICSSSMLKVRKTKIQNGFKAECLLIPAQQPDPEGIKLVISIIELELLNSDFYSFLGVISQLDDIGLALSLQRASVCWIPTSQWESSRLLWRFTNLNVCHKTQPFMCDHTIVPPYTTSSL